VAKMSDSAPAGRLGRRDKDNDFVFQSRKVQQSCAEACEAELCRRGRNQANRTEARAGNKCPKGSEDLGDLGDLGGSSPGAAVAPTGAPDLACDPPLECNRHPVAVLGDSLAPCSGGACRTTALSHAAASGPHRPLVSSAKGTSPGPG